MGVQELTKHGINQADVTKLQGTYAQGHSLFIR